MGQGIECLEIERIGDCDSQSVTIIVNGDGFVAARGRVVRVEEDAGVVVEVPEPVWKTSSGNWARCAPPAISLAAA